MDYAGTIIIVGRTNKARESDSIRQIMTRLEAEGFALHWFESDYTASYADMTALIERRLPSLAVSNIGSYRRLRRLARIMIRVVLIARDKRRYAHVYTGLHGQAANNARQLRCLLDGMAASVHIVTHSAGGISATSIADHPKIASITCFGYPFRHPQREPEPSRTDHLGGVTKPLLFLQGDEDVYGSDPTDFGRHLPASAEVISLACDHDCDRLPPAEYERAWYEITAFLGVHKSALRAA